MPSRQTLEVHQSDPIPAEARVPCMSLQNAEFRMGAFEAAHLGMIHEGARRESYDDDIRRLPSSSRGMMQSRNASGKPPGHARLYELRFSDCWITRGSTSRRLLNRQR